MKKDACAITGHRPKSFPWKYDEADPRCVLLKEVLTAQISELVNSGVTDWFSGMALGVDVWSSEIILSLRKKNPALRLHCVLPCEGQEIKWSTSEQERYHSILRQADEVFYVNQAYSPTCMMERNHYMVEHMAKRKNSRGDGSIHKRKDGRWEGRYVIGRNEKGLPKTKMCWLRPNGSVRKS